MRAMRSIRHAAVIVSLCTAPFAFAGTPPRAALGEVLGMQVPGADSEIGPEYASFAHTLEHALATGEGLPAKGFLNRDRLLDRALKGYESSGEVNQGFRKGFLQAPPIEGALHQQIVRGGDTVKFLRVRRYDGEIRAVFRLLGEDGAVTYLDWVLAKDANGKVEPIDLYTASSGELVSETARSMFEGVVAAQPGLVDRVLGGKTNSLVDALPKITALREKVQQGKFAEGLRLASQIPSPYDRSKTVLLLRFQLASGLRTQGAPDGEREYQAAMADFAKTFPGNPAVDLICLDQMLEQKQYEKALAALDRLEAFTGGDAHLKFLRASILIDRNGPHDLDQADASLDRAIAEEPTLDNPYWGKVTVTLKRPDYVATARALDAVETNLHLKLSKAAIQKSNTYSGFVKSAAFRKWAAAHKD